MVAIPKNWQWQCVRLGTDSWSADENDYVNSVCQEKENSASKRYEIGKWSFGDAVLVTDSTVHCHIALFIGIEIPGDTHTNKW